MVAHQTVQDLTPPQLAVFEVFRRLHASALPEPTLATVSQLSRLKEPTAKLVCEQLKERGILVNGGRSKASYQLASPGEILDVSA